MLSSLFRRLTATVFIVLIASLLGCQSNPTSESAKAKATIQSAIEENNFRLAESLLDQRLADLEEGLQISSQDIASVDDKDGEQAVKIEERRRELDANIKELRFMQQNLRQQSANYVSIATAEVTNIHRQGDWRLADQKLQVVEASAIESLALKDFRTEFDRQRLLKLASLEHRLLMLESRQLPEREMLYRELVKTGYGEASLYSRLRSEQDLKNRVVSALRERAKKAEQQGRVSVALEYLTALARLDSSPEVQSDVQRLGSWLATINAPDARDSTKVRSKVSKSNASKESNRFQNNYEVALVKEDWLLAREILNKELKQRPQSSELKAQDAYLEDKYSQIVEQAKKEAEQLYTSGNIEQALSIWEDALNYAPQDVTLISNVQRANKILKKLETLKTGS